MVTIIAGERGFKDYKKFCAFLEEIGTDITYVYTTGKQAANQMGERWAFENNVPHSKFTENMKKFMIEQAEDLIYFKKKKNKPEMVKQALRAGLEVYEYEF